MASVILASNSPRRKDILKRYIDFTVKSPIVEENNFSYKRPEQLVMALAFEKGYSIAKDYKNHIIISADTVVSIDGEILGKPEDREDAAAMIQKLSGRNHQVLTGYGIFLLDQNIKYIDYEITNVWFKKVGSQMLKQYLDTDSYRSKAGAYGIQDYGALLVQKIEGDYDNVVGLPISKISDNFQCFFDFSLLGGK
ncbi:MAG: nucleoside triphosphate pyrophosphatase [Tissierellia bacterium]|nr:nucleoside triphosphate pyrophosphatase [Tissierellia bacterium]